jgi:hypothetical protein
VGALLVTRGVLRAPVARATQRWRPHFRALDAAVEKDAFQIIFLLRLSPLVPFAVASLLLALTPVPLSTYAAATALGALLSAVPFAYAGHVGGVLAGSAGSAHAGGTAARGAAPDGPYDQLQVLMSVVGLLATVAVSVKLSAVVREALASAAARHSAGSLADAEEGTGGLSGSGAAALRAGAGGGGRGAAAPAAQQEAPAARLSARGAQR